MCSPKYGGDVFGEKTNVMREILDGEEGNALKFSKEILPQQPTIEKPGELLDIPPPWPFQDVFSGTPDGFPVRFRTMARKAF